MNTAISKVVLVTGSTSGIGKAVAKQQIEEGNTVVVNSYEDIGDDFLKKEYGDGQNVYFYRADISTKEEIIKMKEWILEKFGKLDYLVANAGIMPLPCGIDDISDEVTHKTINVNLIGTFWTLKIIGNLIKETSLNGSIVALTSVDGLIGEPYGVIYSATKAGIVSLVKSFARYFKDSMVRVNAVAPGLIDTPLSNSTGEDPCWTTNVSIIKRIGKPEEVANMINFLLSDKASYITGQVMVVDGGFVLK